MGNKPAAAIISRRSDPPGLERGESRGWGRRDSQIPPSPLFGAPARSNKIYTYDVVFIPGEARRNPKSQTSFLINKQRKSADCKSIVACTASTSPPHGSVLDAKASSYLPRGTYADCKSKDKGPGTSPGENNKDRERISRSQQDYSYNTQLPTVRGNGITSLMLDTPVKYITQRSKPRPKPAWRAEPYFRRSM